MKTIRQPLSVIVIGGYLGSGKTSLINNWLAELSLDNTAFLVNDFGAINIDSALISSAGGRTFRLENGCICCTIADGLISSLLSIVQEHSHIDRVIIEASGIANPSKIADIAKLSQSLTLAGVVVLVDSAAIEDVLNDVYVGESVKQQLQSADLLLLNKIDKVEAEIVQRLEVLMSTINPHAQIECCREARYPLGALSNLPRKQKFIRKLDLSLNLNSFTFINNQLFCRQSLDTLLSKVDPLIQRIKGFVRFSDQPQVPYLLQLTRSGWELTPDQSSWEAAGYKDIQSLVVIATEKLDSAAFTSNLESALIKP